MELYNKLDGVAPMKLYQYSKSTHFQSSAYVAITQWATVNEEQPLALPGLLIIYNNPKHSNHLHNIYCYLALIFFFFTNQF